MKKLLLVFLVSMISLSSYAQGDSLNVSNGEISQAERIIDKYGGSAIDEFKKAVKKITPLAEDGFQMVVKFQIAKGVGLLLPLLFFIIGLFTIPFVYKHSVWDHRGNPDNFMALYQIVHCIGIVVLLIAAIFSTYDGILHIIAPEWFAVREIIELAQGFNK